jgi:hypothetical protein
MTKLTKTWASPTDFTIYFSMVCSTLHFTLLMPEFLEPGAELSGTSIPVSIGYIIQNNKIQSLITNLSPSSGVLACYGEGATAEILTLRYWINLNPGFSALADCSLITGLP